MGEDPKLDGGAKGDPKTGLIFAALLDGHGGALSLDWAACRNWHPQDSRQTLWIHMDRTANCVRDWLTGELGFSDETADSLLDEQTRPRAFREGEALITVIRGVNFNRDAEPEDMITLRLWANRNRVLTLRRRPLQTPRDLLDKLEKGQGPRTTGDLVTQIMDQMIEKIGGSIIDMNDMIDKLEAEEGNMHPEDVLSKISTIRRNCLGLKRHMSPQHEALEQIGRSPPKWLDQDNQGAIRESIDRLKRYLEDLDVSKESAILLQDELDSRAAAQSNRVAQLLSVGAAIFLPISFLTGLLGVNVGGIPGTHSNEGFWILCTILAALVGIQLIVFRWIKWL